MQSVIQLWKSFTSHANTDDWYNQNYAVEVLSVIYILEEVGHKSLVCIGGYQ